MLTTFSEDEYVARALDCGASGFLLKSGDPYELIAAVRAVHSGAAFLSPRIAHWVIQHVSDGRMSRQSAARERIAVLSRLEVRNRVQAAVLAYETGLVAQD